MNTKQLEITQAWAEENRREFDMSNMSVDMYNGLVSGIASAIPDETEVLVNSCSLSDETVAAFRHGDAEGLLAGLYRDAMNRRLSALLKQ